MAKNFRVSNYLLVLLLAATTSCSQKVVNFVNSNANFFSYSSFTIINFKKSNADISPEGQIIFSAIERSISSQLTNRNYQEQQTNPDIVARYELISNQRTEINRSSNPYNFPSYGTNYYSSRTLLESALLIELFDTKTKKLIWQASVDLNKYTKRKNKEEILQDAVTKLFNTYLYRAKSNQPDESLITE